MGKTFFEAIGHKLGQKAVQAKNAFELMGGSDEESLRAEIRLGRDMTSALLRRTQLVEENDATKFAMEIGRWLAGHVKEKKLPFQVWVTAEDEPNAFALPGGAVFISWGLLELCRGDRDEIAFVLAHEMGHIVRRHTLDRLVQDAAVSLLLRQTSGQRAASAWLGRAGRELITRAFSREDEFEADSFAQDLIASAGGDPGGGGRLLGRLGRNIARTTSSGRDYFGSHPSVAERLLNLRRRNSENHR